MRKRAKEAISNPAKAIRNTVANILRAENFAFSALFSAFNPPDDGKLIKALV
jgi:hypothetical protein